MFLILFILINVTVFTHHQHYLINKAITLIKNDDPQVITDNGLFSGYFGFSAVNTIPFNVTVFLTLINYKG